MVVKLILIEICYSTTAPVFRGFRSGTISDKYGFRASFKMHRKLYYASIIGTMSCRHSIYLWVNTGFMKLSPINSSLTFGWKSHCLNCKKTLYWAQGNNSKILRKFQWYTERFYCRLLPRNVWSVTSPFTPSPVRTSRCSYTLIHIL